MCGIAGIIGSTAASTTMKRMLAAQSHRGPDAQQLFEEDQVVLGHNRLSIIDLSTAANQPFYSQDRRYVMVFNGEIYNYLELRKTLSPHYDFKTQSDTEVLLAAYIHWGDQCLSRCNGMFAFAIWDRERSHLFAARDRFGVKPFYYHLKDEVLYFGSEIKTLAAAGISCIPDQEVWASYFAYGSYGMPTQTFYKDILQLEAGHCLSWEKGKLSIKRWYDLVKAVEKYSEVLPLKTVKERYLSLLDESIALRFRADVPLGFNVSGGLDSSALLTLVNRLTAGENIRAYTFYTGNDLYDELPWVKALLAHTKNPLDSVLYTATRVSSEAAAMAHIQDEPYGGVPTMAYGAIFRQARSQGVKVLLDGQGMDEQWAGYDYYTKTNATTIQGVKKSPFRPEVLQASFLAKASKPVYPEPFDDTVKNLQFRDLFYTKIPRALRFNDRVSMAASTELREPFLDYRLVEFAFAQPLAYKIHDGIQKYVLRQIVDQHLSSALSFTPKRPLQTPMREWLAGPLAVWVEQQLQPLMDHPWFDAAALAAAWTAYKNGDQDSSFHIWQWVNASLLLTQKSV